MRWPRRRLREPCGPRGLPHSGGGYGIWSGASISSFAAKKTETWWFSFRRYKFRESLDIRQCAAEPKKRPRILEKNTGLLIQKCLAKDMPLKEIAALLDTSVQEVRRLSKNGKGRHFVAL